MIPLEGVRVLDVSSDVSHNRTVLTLAGPAAALKQGVLALVDVAIRLIDLRSHSGDHPRLGAVDVVRSPARPSTDQPFGLPMTPFTR